MILPTTRLKNVAEIRVSNVDKKSVPGEREVRLCNYVDVYKNETITPGMALMSATASAEQCRDFRVRAGDTLITKDSETADDIAVPAYVREATPDMLCGYHLAVVRPGNQLHPKFLYWTLASLPFQRQMSALATGVTRFGLRQEVIGGGEIPLTSVEEQRRIADFLDAETARMGVLTDAMARQIETLKQHRLRVLDRVMEGTENVVRARLGYVVELVTSGSRAWSGYVAGSGRPFFRSANLCPDSVHPNLSSLVHVALPSPTMSEATRSRIQRDDVLVGITGANAGWVALADDKVVGGHVSQHVCLVRPERRRIAGRWLAYIIASPTIQESLLGSQYGGTKTQLSLPDIRDLRVPIVPVEQQEKTVRDVEGRIHLIDRQRRLRARQLDLLTERRTALVTAAVTGEFDVSSASGRGVTE